MHYALQPSDAECVPAPQLQCFLDLGDASGKIAKLESAETKAHKASAPAA